jgi:poly-gamma-glutamate synthesis protein (capsule biosynthesis protein)
MIHLGESADLSPQRWELLAVGDVMLGRGVARNIHRYGQDYILACASLIKDSSQILAGNLESPVCTQEFTSQSPYRFKADPAAAGSILKKNWRGFLSVANNHALDCGLTGFNSSLSFLDSLEIPYSGVVKEKRESDSLPPKIVSRPAFLKIGKARVGYLAFCQKYMVPATAQNVIAPADSATIVNSIREVADSCDVIVASFHWGYEYQQNPSKTQKYLGRLAIRHGARIVLGHHPHVLQGLEFYRGGIIAYSLGNFIFDQKDSLANQSAILHVKMKGAELDSVWLEPVVIENKRPVTTKGIISEEFSRQIKELCKGLGTRTKKKDNRLYLF